MSSWLAMKQALTAMDLVTRGWARDLDLDECGVMVNRPGGDGWRRGLLVPHELRRASIRTRASMEEGLLDPPPPAAETSLPLEAGHHESISGNPNWTDAERESVARAWQALWR